MGKINQTTGLAVLAGNLLMMLSYVAMTCPANTFIGRYYQYHHMSFRDTAPIFFLGCMVGPILSCIAAYLIGRRLTLGITGALTSVGLIFVAAEFNVDLLLFGRFLMGVSVGGVQAVMPIYFGEIAEKPTRGVLVATLSVSLHIGKILDILLRHLDFYHTHQVIVIVLAGIFSIFFLIFGLETPHYYIQKNKRQSAMVNLQRLRFAPHHKIAEEFEDILVKTVHPGEERVMTCFKSNGWIKSLIVLFGLNFLIYISMVDNVSHLDYIIFDVDGINIGTAIVIGVIQVASSLFCMSIIDRLGRKICLLVSISGMILSILILLVSRNFAGTTTPFIAFIYFIISSSFAIPSVPFVSLGELFSPKFKMAGAAIVNANRWFFTFVAFFILEISIDHDVWLSIVLVFCVLAAPFVHFCIPETKGKSFSEIQTILNRM